MHKSILCLTLATVLHTWNSLPAQELPPRTALDDYLARPDASYSWKIVKNDDSPQLKTLVIDLVSQTWRTTKDVNQTKWRHWLTLAIPAKLTSDVGLLWIGGGRNGGKPPAGPSARIKAIAQATGTVVAELKMVPNQPLIFHNDGARRTEDDLIAYTWDQFLKTGDVSWPARNPMVKSAVRALDTITAVTKTAAKRSVKRFVVAGGSKRGWTTWLTGATDKRVIGIVPIVIDVLNVKANTQHHFAAYGFWAPSLGDYVEHRITERMEHSRMPQLLKLVDPWFYRHRLTMPKFILNAAGDQFFLPDASRHYFKGLLGPKHLRYVPNADHSLRGSDAIESLIAWYSLIVAGKSAPRFSWTSGPNTIRVTTVDKPQEVRLWQATNPAARDFRLESLGPKYKSRVLHDQGNGTYVAKRIVPKKGWTASFVELTFAVNGRFPLKLTTDVQITPDVLPYKNKNPGLPATITVRCTAPNKKTATAIEKGVQQQQIKAVASGMQFRQLRPDPSSSKVTVQLNWKPVGRFGRSARVITAWLRGQGCADFRYQLESGNKPTMPDTGGSR